MHRGGLKRTLQGCLALGASDRENSGGHTVDRLQVNCRAQDIDDHPFSTPAAPADRSVLHETEVEQRSSLNV